VLIARWIERYVRTVYMKKKKKSTKFFSVLDSP